MSTHLVHASTALFRFQLNGFSIVVQIQVTNVGSILRRAKATHICADCLLLPYTLRLDVSLNRASYGQLTEGGPLSLPPSHNIIHKVDTTTLSIYNPHLGAQLVATLDLNRNSVDLQHVKDEEAFDAPLGTTMSGRVHMPPGEIAVFIPIAPA
jgi:hypothetical protein